MAGGMLGLDPELVRQMAAQFDQEAQNIQSLMTKLESVISSNIPSAWNGNDANQFQQDWAGRLKSALHQVAQELTTASTNAKRNIEQQQTASA